jgi:hypothetical protein
MMSMDAIHVHVKMEREHTKIEGNIALEIDYCLWEMHEN